MSHIGRRKMKTGVSWRVRFVDPEGRERSKSFKRKAEAEDFETSISHSLRSGAYVDPSAGQQTVKDYLEEWRKQQAQHRPKTVAGTATRFKTMVYPHIGDLPIGKVKPSTIRGWQTTLLQTYAPASVVGVRGQVAGAFNDAVLDRKIAASPFTGVKAPEVIKVKVVPRTIEQVRAGEAAMVERYRAIVPFVAGTGLRASETLGVTRDRVDFLRRTVLVDRQLVGRVKREPRFGPPKTKSSYRTVPLPKHVVAVLAAHLAKYPAEPHELVFRTAQGTPITRGVFHRPWVAAREAMGLAEGEGLHQLRHFYASLLIARGRSVVEVQERLGHATAQETLDTYAHLFPDSDEGTRDAIDDAFAEESPNKSETDESES